MKKLIAVLVLMFVLVGNVSMVTVKGAEVKTYEYYGMVEGNGKEANVYLKVGNEWEIYKIKADYFGKEAKLIVLDRMINNKNYKTVRVVNIKEIDYSMSDKVVDIVNRMIREFNDR